MKRLIILWLCSIPFITTAQKKDSAGTDLPRTPQIMLSDADSRAAKLLPQYAPLSPNAWSAQKFGDYQVNLATGIPSISIPLHSIKSGNLSMPITLNCHTGGFKLNEQASWVGWGWSLDFGASMNRTVQGFKDDKDGGSYVSNPITVSRDFCNNATDFSYGQAVVTNQVDTQPDIFSYNIPSKSGKFLLGQNGGSPFKIPNYPVQIAYSGSPNFDIFYVVGDDGTVYNFGETEGQQVVSGANTQSYTSSWLLTQVRSANSNDAITYYYQNGGSQYLSEKQWVSTMLLNQTGGYYTNSSLSTPTYTTVETTINQKNPYKITYTNGEVEFIQSNNGERQDLTSSHYLKQINIYNYENTVKTLIKVIRFTYSYFSGRRLKLDKITITDELTTFTEEYNFDYWSNTISWNETTDNEKKDFFGYYNGKPNTHLIPASNYSGVPVNGGAADRATVSTYMKEGVLKRITYPTKGYTEFDFETNKYHDGVSELFAGGLRVKSIKSMSGNNGFLKRYVYSTEAGEGIGRLTTNWTPASAASPALQTLFYSDAGGTVNGMVTQASFTQSGGAVDLNTVDAAPVYYTTVTEYFEEAADAVKNGRNVYTFDFRQDLIVNALNYTSRDVQPWKRGNLLTKTTYDKDNNIVAIVDNTYQELLADTRTAGGFVNTPNVYQGSIVRSTIPCPTTFLRSSYYAGDFPEMVYTSVNYHTGINLIQSSVSQINNVAITQATTYNNELYAVQIQTSDSQTGSSLSEHYKYPSDAAYSSDPVALEMLSRNQRNQPLETELKETISSVTTSLYKEKKVFDFFTGTNPRGYTNNILMKELWSAPKSGTLEKRVSFTDYDTHGNPLSYIIDDLPISLVWGYNNALLLGEIRNATRSQTDIALGSASITPVNMSTTELSTTQLGQLQNLRTALPNAHISWYSYRPQVGLSNTVSPNGIVRRFTYDKLNRLKGVFDHNNYLTDLYRYVYATTTPTDCMSPAAPVVSITSSTLCDITLSASGCAGVINWSNGGTGSVITVTSKNSVSYTATCTISDCTSQVSNVVTTPSLPAGWTAAEIGSPSVAGCVQYSSGTWTLRGTGNTFGASDNINYAYQEVSGNAIIVVRLENMSSNSEGMRSGIMLRSSTDPTANYYQFFFDSGYQVLSLYEQNSSTPDGQLGYQAVTIPKWLRLKKNGSSVSVWYTSSASPDWNNDADWTLYTEQSSALFSGNYLLGILVYNNAYSSTGLSNETTFSNVSVHTF